VIEISIPCVDADRATQFATWLRLEGVDVSRVDGVNVVLPTDNPVFAWDVAEAANKHGYADDDAVSRAVASKLDQAGIR
jgi:hypothetical protein